MPSTSSSHRVLGLTVATLVCVAACGGTSGIDLFSNADGGPGGQADEAGTASSGGTSGTSGTSGNGADGGATIDGGGEAEGGTRPGGDTATLPCGAASCALATDVCCLTSAGGQGGQGATFACMTTATCPRPSGTPQDENDSVTLKCTGAANCGPGTVCCIDKAEDAVTARCAAACNGDQAQLCDPAAATTGCSASQPCSNEKIREWRLPRTFGTCGGKGD